MKILKGNLVSAPALGKLEIVEHGCLVLHDDGSIQSVEKAVPQNADAEVIDYGDSLIMPSFVDMHLHAPQYPMLGMGMDLPLIDWLNTYTFKTEARFEGSDYARRIYKKLASDLITSGTTRVCMFSSLHTDATLILMEELKRRASRATSARSTWTATAVPSFRRRPSSPSAKRCAGWTRAGALRPSSPS